MKKFFLSGAFIAALKLFSFSLDEGAMASFDEPKRLLLLDGDDGTVACRVYGSLLSGTLPRFSDEWGVELATRSLLRMKNLTAVRGSSGESMLGPLDYFGNLEAPHRYLYTIKGEFPPVWYRHPLPAQGKEKGVIELQTWDERLLTVIHCTWISGRQEEVVEEKRLEYNVTPKHLRQSLFLYPGFLEVDRSFIELPYFDARGVNLGSFKAELVDNSIPFRITEKELPAKDDYRLVTYLYEPSYADWQVENGSGLFLEKHQFSQTITPLSPDSRGFVVLARTNERPDELELIAVQIPYGYTLLIKEGCIHGDATLQGLFMMGMTSDHTTMRTADTVFLKSPMTKKNVKMALVGEPDFSPSPPLKQIPPPYVVYRNSSEEARMRFKELTRGKNFIFTPFSREYWR